MYRKSKSQKMVAAKYKQISGRLNEHFGFKLLNDENVKNVDKVYCVHCEKSFAYHGSNTTFTYHL